MSNIWRIFRDDLRYAHSNIVSILVVLGLCLAPALYACFNIAGSWDPSANTGQLKVAVANSDDGFQSDLVPVRVNIGDRVIDTLRSNDEYGWTFVNENDAIDGVKSGEYYAAIVIPGDFSQSMMSALSSDTEQAVIGYYLNLKENPIASVIADEDEAELLEDIQEEFADAVDALAIDLASDLVSFVDSDKIGDFGSRLVSRLSDVADDLDDASSQVRAFSRVVESASTLSASTARALSGSDDQSNASNGTIAQLTDELDDAVKAIVSAVSLVNDSVRAAKTDTGLDGITDDAARHLADDASSLASSVTRAKTDTATMTDSLQDAVETIADSAKALGRSLTSARNALGTAANRLNASASKARQFRDDISAAIAKGNSNEITRLVGTNASTLTQWLSAPVEIEKHTLNAVANYGSSIAPFYLILAIWAGVVVLAVIMSADVSKPRIRRYEEERTRPVRNYERFLGRYLIFLTLSLAQATVAALGALLFLRVQCAQPALLLAACWACALVFSGIVYAFALSFGGIGKALCVILLALQVTGSVGGYPVQMMSDFFQAVYPFLPFAYGMSAMQSSIVGVYGVEYLMDLARLLAFLAVPVLLGMIARRPIMRFSDFFARKLKESDLM